MTTSSEFPLYLRIFDGNTVVSYPRIAHPGPSRCPDCGINPGEVHGFAGCDQEECPRCHGQMLSCDCVYEDDLDADDEVLP